MCDAVVGDGKLCAHTGREDRNQRTHEPWIHRAPDPFNAQRDRHLDRCRCRNHWERAIVITRKRPKPAKPTDCRRYPCWTGGAAKRVDRGRVPASHLSSDVFPTPPIMPPTSPLCCIPKSSRTSTHCAVNYFRRNHRWSNIRSQPKPKLSPLPPTVDHSADMLGRPPPHPPSSFPLPRFAAETLWLTV